MATRCNAICQIALQTTSAEVFQHDPYIGNTHLTIVVQILPQAVAHLTKGFQHGGEVFILYTLVAVDIAGTVPL